jgi:dextranase
VAAYQHVYSEAPAEQADQAARFTMAALFSSGAAHLLAGESGSVLTDPYYVHNHPAEPSTLNMLRRWYDFLTAQGELLTAPGVHDVTSSWYGPYNNAVTLEWDGCAVTTEPTPGAIWARVTRPDGPPGTDRLVAHTVNLTQQTDIAWDSPKTPVEPLSGGLLRVRRVGAGLPRAFTGNPDCSPGLRELLGRQDGAFAVFNLPPLATWQVTLVEF